MPRIIDAIKYITVKMGLYDFGSSYLICKSSNILKYNYNLKWLFSIWIYFKIKYAWSKLYFQHHYCSLQCHMIFRNHSNMTIHCSRNNYCYNIYYYNYPCLKQMCSFFFIAKVHLFKSETFSVTFNQFIYAHMRIYYKYLLRIYYFI